MGSVKDLIVDDSPAGKYFSPPKSDEFGSGAWRVKGTFSVKDMKGLIPASEVPNKPAAMAMMNAAFFEYLDSVHPEIPTCYMGLLSENGELHDVQHLLDRGMTSNIVLMRLAHVPDSWCNGDLAAYREDLASGALQCGVADVESIFRHGCPLGSSTFKGIFEAAGMGKEYETLATYDQVVTGLNRIRAMVEGNGIEAYPKLAAVLKKAKLKEIPNPGHIIDGFTYNTTSKFELAGDRPLTENEQRRFSGLDEEGYELWDRQMFPDIANAQVDFVHDRNGVNIDGKCECVAYRKRPVLTDFACTTDENRIMLTFRRDGITYLIPTNKEIQRAIFTAAGVDAAISEAKSRALARENSADNWRSYMPDITGSMGIDLRAVSEHSCRLMGYAIGEVANRILRRRVFDTPPVGSWVREFLPYASRLQV